MPLFLHQEFFILFKCLFLQSICPTKKSKKPKTISIHFFFRESTTELPASGISTPSEVLGILSPIQLQQREVKLDGIRDQTATPKIPTFVTYDENSVLKPNEKALLEEMIKKLKEKGYIVIREADYFKSKADQIPISFILATEYHIDKRFRLAGRFLEDITSKTLRVPAISIRFLKRFMATHPKNANLRPDSLILAQTSFKTKRTISSEELHFLSLLIHQKINANFEEEGEKREELKSRVKDDNFQKWAENQEKSTLSNLVFEFTHTMNYGKENEEKYEDLISFFISKENTR